VLGQPNSFQVELLDIRDRPVSLDGEVLEAYVSLYIPPAGIRHHQPEVPSLSLSSDSGDGEGKVTSVSSPTPQPVVRHLEATIEPVTPSSETGGESCEGKFKVSYTPQLSAEERESLADPDTPVWVVIAVMLDKGHLASSPFMVNAMRTTSSLLSLVVPTSIHSFFPYSFPSPWSDEGSYIRERDDRERDSASLRSFSSSFPSFGEHLDPFLTFPSFTPAEAAKTENEKEDGNENEKEKEKEQAVVSFGDLLEEFASKEEPEGRKGRGRKGKGQPPKRSIPRGSQDDGDKEEGQPELIFASHWSQHIFGAASSSSETQQNETAKDQPTFDSDFSYEKKITLDTDGFSFAAPITSTPDSSTAFGFTFGSPSSTTTINDDAKPQDNPSSGPFFSFSTE